MKAINLRNKFNSSTKIISKKEKHRVEQQQILRLTEELSKNAFTDTQLDRDNEIIKLLSGKEVTLGEIKSIQKSIAKSRQAYRPTYPQEYYKLMFKLCNLTLPPGKISYKPKIFARYTNEIIYARFSKEVLPMLQHLNPMVALGIRKYKHFQFLTPEAYTRVQTYIQDSIQTMEECTEWYEFRLKYARKYNLSFQLNLLEDNEGHLK